MQANISNNVIKISDPSKRHTVGNQRSTPRLPLTYTLSFSRPGEAWRVVTKTENVNCKGFYCVSERRFSLFERLDCEMVIPWVSSQFGRGDLILLAVVEVLRITPRGMGRGFGMACRLENYTIGPRSNISTFD